MLKAVIRESDCVGCGQCLPACPVDAIIGTVKWMHTVLEQDCIGCKLCVTPCPMDCIEMVEKIESLDDVTRLTQKNALAHRAKKRFQIKKMRLKKEEILALPHLPTDTTDKLRIQTEIQESLRRAREKRTHF